MLTSSQGFNEAPVMAVTAGLFGRPSVTKDRTVTDGADGGPRQEHRGINDA